MSFVVAGSSSWNRQWTVTKCFIGVIINNCDDLLCCVNCIEVPPCGLNKLVKMTKDDSEVILVTGEFNNYNIE